MPNIFDQFDQPQARVMPQPPAGGGNIFDQFDDAPEAKPLTSAEQQERARLVEELKQRTAAADEAGRDLSRKELVADVSRPLLRGAVDLADGALGIPKLAAAIPVAGLNLAGANIRSPLSYSLKEIGSDKGKSLQPRNDSEQLASTVTQTLGGVLGGVGAGGALAAGRGAASSLGNIGRTLAANPGLQTAGAVTGGTASDVARRAGAGPVGQAVAGIAGGLVPSTATQAGVRTANKVAAGLTRTPEAQRLLDAGVDLTPGQLNPKGFTNQLEETLQSVGVIGPTIRNARDNARDTFQRAASQEGAAPGATIAQSENPAQMLDEAYQSFQPLYDQARGFPLRPLILNTSGPNVPLDQALQRAISNRGIRATDADRAAIQGVIDDQLTKGIRSSEDLLDIRSAIRAEAREAAAEGNAPQSRLLRAADEQLTRALESQLPPEPLQALRAADSRYGNYKTLEAAVDRGSTKPDGFTAFDLQQSVRGSNRGTNRGNYARGGGGPLRQLADDARQTIDGKSPANGSRLAAVPAAAALAPLILGGAVTQTGRRIAQGATPTQQALGQRLGPAQQLIADPYNEQLALALQQLIQEREAR